ncbi:MAG: molecular chaperone HtpG [Oscillospiraceae bacterium]|nr:molecular chaperone HtpG [Oscillospiraceae bacterium]
MAKKQFKTESKKLLDMMINSIYTHKEIFLREIISNASDAIDKLCYRSLTDENVGMERGDFRIRITVDKENRLITVSDNGIGMTKEELENNLGVIARSGSLKFKDGLEEEEQENAAIDIIGQFGVGFYSSFMVSDRVTVITKAYGSDEAFRWESSGVDGYTVNTAEKDTVGTDVIMHIKPDDETEKYSTYLENWKLMMLIKKYSDYVRWPIVMDVERSEMVETGEVDENGKPKTKLENITVAETVNSMVPIWQRSRAEATDEECIAFYKEKYRDEDDPLAVIRVNAEGLISYRALLFVPSKTPQQFYTRESEPGLELYSSGVMIMDKCTELLPDCYAFARGVVDSPDLTLNISRETLQHDRQLKLIATNLGKKMKNELVKLMRNDREKYEKFYNAFGMVLRTGAISEYGDKVDDIKDLLLYNVSDTKLVSFKEYVDAMPAEQEKIYYACGDSVRRLMSLPQAELLREKGYEVLCMTSQFDEYLVDTLKRYDDKPFCNIAVEDLGLETEEQKKETEAKEAEAKELLAFVKETLGDAIERAVLSHKLVSGAVCLSTEGGVTLEMERYFRNMPGAPEHLKAIRILEFNAAHPAYQAMAEAFAEDDKEKAAKIAKILHAQALLIAGDTLEDPAAYSELVCSLIQN